MLKFFRKLNNRIKQLIGDNPSIKYIEYFEREEIKTEYVGFIDILGFSSAVSNNYQEILQKYNAFINHVRIFGSAAADDLRIRVLSDSIILTSKKFSEVLQGTNLLLHATLGANFMTRGGLASGRHIDIIEDENYYMVSEALVKAVSLEKNLNPPCIVLHEDLWPTKLDLLGFSKNNFLNNVLYFKGNWIVNPFNIMWGTSAATRVRQLKEKHPEYSDKYDWFLELYEAIKNGKDLISNKGPYYYPRK